MKKIILVIIVIILVVTIIIFINKNKEVILSKEKELVLSGSKLDINEFLNSVMHRSDYNSGYYGSTYVFLENGEYYFFYQQYDAMVRDKAYKGKWSIEDNIIKAVIEEKVYLEGGETVEVNEQDNYINKTKIVNGKLQLQEYETTFFLNVKKEKGEKGTKYSEYLTIEDTIYYPIYEYNTVEETKEKLKEMYGEIFTLLEQ